MTPDGTMLDANRASLEGVTGKPRGRRRPAVLGDAVVYRYTRDARTVRKAVAAAAAGEISPTIDRGQSAGRRAHLRHGVAPGEKRKRAR